MGESTDKGKFAFTTDDYDVFEICFISRVPSNMRGGRHEVFLGTKHGVEAKNYEGLGDAAKLKPLEVELKRLEDLSESIVQDFAHMRQREEEMGHKRVYELAGSLLLALLNVLPPRTCHLAGALPEKILQV